MGWFSKPYDPATRKPRTDEEYLVWRKHHWPDWERSDDAHDQWISGIKDPHPWKPGAFWIGETINDRDPVGLDHERHCLTVAGARAGKGVAVIIPNLLKWKGSALVVDPKGEAAEATAEARERMGQSVYVLDPFESARVPERFRKRFNPLARLDPSSRRCKEDIGVIADGLVLRDDPRAGHWDDGGLTVIAGLIAQAITTLGVERHTLPEVRKLLALPSPELGKLVDEMQANEACGGLPVDAADALTKSGTEASHFMSIARKSLKWIGSEPIADLLAASDFELAELKLRPTTIYLVLPADLIEEHGRFLRLFVRSAIWAMAQKMPDGSLKGERCLFILDEFAALGHIGEIAKNAGLMPGYGVHLWPFLQTSQQIDELYGNEGWGALTGNASLVQFFGNTDTTTLKRIAEMMPGFKLDQVAMIREHIAKRTGMKVARRMLVFLDGEARPYNLRLTPYFDSPHFK